MPKLNLEESRQLLRDLELKSVADLTDEWISIFLGKLADPVKLAAWNKLLDLTKEFDPNGYARLNAHAAAHRGFHLEYQGFEKWLMALGPHTFTGEFSDFHKDIWDWYWPTTLRQRAGKAIDLEDITYLAIWGRGLGKSSNSEWLAIAEGALVGKGFVLFVCGTAEQAEAHVEAIRDRLETEGDLSRLYPGMGKPTAAKGGKGGFVGEHRQYGWRQDYLMTSNGWAIRPVGLDKAIRGWKRGDARVSMIIFDDIDDDDDSPEVIMKKERRISKKILPMGTARTKVVFAQNLIHSNSVLNRIHTRQTDILALRRGDVPIKAFDEIEIEHQQTPKGPRWKIVKGVPTWPHIDMAECQSFLDRSGKDAFLAEYQHNFEGEQNDRVLPEYDDRVLRAHVITWSQYEAKYGHRRIPSDWPCDAGLDIGYTTGHKSAWTFLAKAPEYVELPGSIFRYRGRTFTGVGIDEQAVVVRRDMWPDEKIERELMSHEKLGERMVLNSKHGWHMQPCESAKTAGIPQWRHYLVCDRTKPHPFHRDEKMPDGLWKIGCPSWFDIVDDDQFIAPRDDRGLKTHRDQAYLWKMRKVEETKSGMTVEQPMKANEDSCDSTRALTAGTAFGPADARATLAQRIQRIIPSGYHKAELQQRTDLDSFQRQFTNEVAEYLAKRSFKAAQGKMEYDEFGQVIGRAR